MEFKVKFLFLILQMVGHCSAVTRKNGQRDKELLAHQPQETVDEAKDGFP